MTSRYVLYEAPAFTAIRDSFSDNPCDLLVTIHTKYKDQNGTWQFFSKEDLDQRKRKLLEIFNKD